MSNKTEQASHFLKPAPEKLSRLIEIVNLLPPDYELTHPIELRDEANLDESNPIQAVIRLSAHLEKYAETLPPEFRDYLLSEDASINFLDSLHEGGSLGRYETFWDAKECLRLLARMAKKSNYTREVVVSVKGTLIPTTYNIEIDPHGQAQTKTNITVSLVDEALKGVDATRVRECQICNKIFWAGRTNQHCCSKNCAHVLRTRRWREKYQDHYKLQRNGYKPRDKDLEKNDPKLNKKGR